MLQVVDLGQRMGGTRELGMADDVSDPLAVDPDRPLPAQSVQELLARPRRHSLSSLALDCGTIRP
jgi:hypothetical protein